MNSKGLPTDAVPFQKLATAETGVEEDEELDFSLSKPPCVASIADPPQLQPLCFNTNMYTYNLCLCEN